MHAPAMLADHLDSRTDEIIAVWRLAVGRGGNVPDAERLTHGEFVDHIPKLLDRLAERLRGQPADPATAGQEHGWMRWQQGYDIREVVGELGHLRTALSRATFDYAREHDFDISTLESIWSVIDEVLVEATSEAVGQFQESGAAEIQGGLARAEERQQAVEDAWIVAEVERTKLRAVLDNLPVGVWVADASGRVVAVNREGERLQVPSRVDRVGPEVVRQPGTESPLSAPSGSPSWPDDAPIARALRGETVSQEEIAWPSDREARTVTVNATPLSDTAGAIIGAVMVAQDVTGRKRMEEQLHRQLEFTRAITDNMGEGVYVVDAQGLNTFMNPAAERSLGWTATELRGRDMHELIHYRHPHGSSDPAEDCPLRNVIRSRTPASGDEVFIRKDGTMFPVAYTLAPIVTDGAFTGAVMTFRDITERKRLEASLAASEARFRSIAERSPVLTWRSGLDGLRDFFNQTWYEFRGRTREQEIGEGWTEGVHPDDLQRFLETSQRAFERREVFELTYRLRRHDGVYRWITARGVPYADDDGNFLGYLGSCLDITERIELESALKEQRELAEEASRHKTRLLAALSHDARTPLNAVVLSVQLLEMHHEGNRDEEVEQCLRTIRHSVLNVLDLLGDLLNLTKIDAGALPAQVSRFDLEPVLAESLSSIEAQAKVKGLDVRLEPGGLAGLALESDRSKLKQILCNLLSNALRYTERGQIRLLGERATDQIRISVEDTGVGINPADQQRVFDEFATLDNPHRPTGEGTGLGLAICRRLANLLKGEITLQSAPGRGSTFTLVLPASIVTASPSEDGPTTPSTDPPASGAVLIAEDHLTSRQTLAKVLRRMGYRVMEAGNGRDALTLARQERPLVVLMDVNMPVMDGIDATLALRADPRFRDLPIFALTGDVSILNQRRIGEAGVNGYLEKPVTWDVLKRTLESLQDRAE